MPLVLPYERCRMTGCNAKATRIPVLCVPKTGREPTRENSIESRFFIPCCADHLPEPRDVMSDKLIGMFVQMALKSPGKPALNFDKAFMVAESMLTAKFLKMRAEYEKRGQKPIGFPQ